MTESDKLFNRFRREHGLPTLKQSENDADYHWHELIYEAWQDGYNMGMLNIRVDESDRSIDESESRR
jgi:hypothetical protein